MMERVNRILQHDIYRKCLRRIEHLEADRIFCGHDMAHFLDVARLAYLFNLEEGLGISKELIYTAALLHDVGRHIQYEQGIPHQTAGIPIAEQIMEECGYSSGERKEILDAIACHRSREVKAEKNLRGILYRADKMSRACFGCRAGKVCDWDREKKNSRIEY